MSMQFCVDAEQLRKALAEIEAAEKNGFMHCLAVMEMTIVGPMISQCRATYSDLLERAHPTNGHLDWGRFQRVTAKNTFKDGKLRPIEAGKPRKQDALGAVARHRARSEH